MHVVIDTQHRVLASALRLADLEQTAADHGARIVNIGTADVATCAKIAAADYPKMTAVGDGFLGAGTHPAQPYLHAMLGMTDVGVLHSARTATYGYDSAQDIVQRFLGNATAWKGETARAVKARLKEIVR